MITKEELQGYFENVDEDKRQFAYDTIDEYIFFREKIEELKQFPDVEISKKNPQKIRLTPAAKLRKEYSQILDAKRGTLLRILYRVENTAEDALVKLLEEYE